MHKFIFIFIAVYSIAVFANPYFDEQMVPKDQLTEAQIQAWEIKAACLNGQEIDGFICPEVFAIDETAALPVLRVRVDWKSDDETYSLNHAVIENSGTRGLYKRSSQKPKLGSYIGILKDATTGKELSYDSVGMGAAYRKLARALSFRFPVPQESVILTVLAENPSTGKMEEVLKTLINAGDLPKAETKELESKILKASTSSYPIQVNVYAEGYTDDRKSQFYKDAQRIADVFSESGLDIADSMNIAAVFSPSNTKLGKAKDLGSPVEERDSFLGLYFPYWFNFGRWYHVLYPTSEEKFRAAIGQVPYDYAVVVVDDSQYWGVGNYKELTAVPARNGRLSYLLLHEFGHFMGLNEEYEGGGRTELEFAPAIQEPWSQNITFLSSEKHDDLKWKYFVNQNTPIPTPKDYWEESNHAFGAYLGGYGDSNTEHSHKPGYACIMDRFQTFCDVCKKAMSDVVRFDGGQAQN